TLEQLHLLIDQKQLSANDVPASGTGVGNPKASSGGGTRQAATAAIREQKSALDALLASMSQELALSKETERQRAIDTAVINAQAAAQRDYDAGLRDSPLLDPATVKRVQDTAAAQFDLAHQQRDAATAARDQSQSLDKTQASASSLNTTV